MLLRKTCPPLFFKYQEKWTHGTRENPFSGSPLFALLGEGGGVASAATSTSEGLASFSTEMVFGCHSPIFFFTRIFSLFLFSILFVRVSQSLFTTSLQLEPSRPKRWHWTWLFMAALASIGTGRPWKPLSLFFCAITRLKRASLTSSCLLQNPKRPFPN